MAGPDRARVCAPRFRVARDAPRGRDDLRAGRCDGERTAGNEELATCEAFDERGIGRWEMERHEIGARHPPHLLPEPRAWTSQQRAAIEVERHRSILVGVARFE